MKLPKDGSVLDIVEVTAKAALGIIALAAAAQGWALRRTTLVERALLTFAGLLLVFPSLIEAFVERISGRDISYTATLGLIIGAAVLIKQWLSIRAPSPAQAA